MPFIEQMKSEANRQYPKETGGCLMGYLSDNKKDIVITDIVGPGSKATHKNNSFIPDYDYQERKVAEIYKKTGRTSTYLGDWHTHPDGRQSLSNIDVTALQNISAYSKARTESPIMVILSGSPSRWTLSAWQLLSKKFLFVRFVKFLREVKLRIH